VAMLRRVSDGAKGRLMEIATHMALMELMSKPNRPPPMTAMAAMR
jgi:hypothetical protein